MAQRLPTVGGDNGNWGQILNDYLSVEHNSDGSLKIRTDGTLSSGIADGSITASKLSSTVNNYLASAQTAVQSVNGKSGQSVSLTASDVSAIATTAAGSASGVATLDGDSKLTASQVPNTVVKGSEVAVRSIDEIVTAGAGSDDRSALQAAVDAAVAGDFALALRPGATYRISSSVGSKNFKGPTGSTSSTAYGVSLPSGLRLIGNGATLLCDSGDNFVAVCNANTASEVDTLTIQGPLTIDGGGRESVARDVPMVRFYGLQPGSSLVGIHLTNASYSAGVISRCTGTFLDDLTASAITGQGWEIGGNTHWQLSHCRIGRLDAWDIADYGTFNQPGNGFVIGGDGLVIDRVSQRNCAGGIKFVPFCSADVGMCFTDGTVLAGETDRGTNNCGTKIQGDDGSNQAGRVTIAKVVSRKQKGAGLYVRYADHAFIGEYFGYQNGLNGTDHDIDVGQFTRLDVSKVVSSEAGKSGVVIGTGAGRWTFGDVIVDNPSAVAAANADGFAPLAGEGKVDYLEVWDRRSGTPAIRAYQGTSDSICEVGRYRTNCSNSIDLRYARHWLGAPIISSGTAPRGGTVTLTGSTTQADISNANVRTNNVNSGWVEPIVQFTPMNAAARTLGVPRYSIPSNFTIRLLHASAAGGEVFAWEIIGYRWRTTQFS